MEPYNCVIQAGHLACSHEPALIFTVCGNGLVLTMRDKFKGVGAIAHCIYPRAKAGEKPSHFHADVAVRSLIRLFGRSPVAPEHRFEAQLIGGGNYRGANHARALATANTVRTMMKRLKIPLVSEDIGGTLGRKIIFNTSTGETMILKTSRIRRSDWLPELLGNKGYKRIAYKR